MGKFVYDERNGYNYVSDNGIVYDLLEGECLGGKATSDIIFIMVKYTSDVFDEWLGSFGNSDDELVGWVYGASEITETDGSCLKDDIEQRVKRYEENNPRFVKLYRDIKSPFVEGKTRSGLCPAAIFIDVIHEISGVACDSTALKCFVDALDSRLYTRSYNAFYVFANEDTCRIVEKITDIPTDAHLVLKIDGVQEDDGIWFTTITAYDRKER